jgi:hypothetical protein
MPSEQYCEDLLDKISDKIDDWLDAYDDMRDAEADLIEAGEDQGEGFVDSLIDVFTGNWGDAGKDVSHLPGNDAAFDRAGAKLDRALDKLDRLKDKIDELDDQWCDECGDAAPEPEPEEDDNGSDDDEPVEEIVFSEEEGMTIEDYTKTGWE